MKMKKGVVPHLNKPKVLSLKDSLWQAWLKLTRGSGEEDENVKGLRRCYRQHQGKRRRKTKNFDQISSLQPSGQVSKELQQNLSLFKKLIKFAIWLLSYRSPWRMFCAEIVARIFASFLIINYLI